MRSLVLLCVIVAGICLFIDEAGANSERRRRGACPAMCTEDKSSKSCGNDTKQWFFNKKTKSCEEFVYGGCGGNENRFKNIGLCERMCKAKC